MGSINRHIVHERISLVYDTVAGAQMQNKGIKEYVKSLRKSVKLTGAVEGAGDVNDFFREVGKGI